jgi:hypothetical protein
MILSGSSYVENLLLQKAIVAELCSIYNRSNNTQPPDRKKATSWMSPSKNRRKLSHYLSTSNRPKSYKYTGSNVSNVVSKRTKLD